MCIVRENLKVAYPFDWFSLFDSKDLIHNALKTKAHKNCLFK